MKTKSDENIKAAELLVEGNMYASSVHCSYYACFQLMKYVLHAKLNFDYIQQDKLTKGKGSHNLLIGTFKKKYRVTDKKAAFKIATDIDLLKKNRQKADYTPTVICDSTKNEVEKLKKDIIQQLNNIT